MAAGRSAQGLPPGAGRAQILPVFSVLWGRESRTAGGTDRRFQPGRIGPRAAFPHFAILLKEVYLAMPKGMLNSWMSLLLSAWLSMQPAWTQPPAEEGQGGLRIAIIEGEQAILNVRQRVAREAIIQVEDENRRPVAGALLTLTAPRDGASVVFSNGLNNITLTTDEMGRAVVHGIRPNGVQGQFSIRISAVKDGMHGTAEMRVSNAAPAGGGPSLKLLSILAAAGAAATAIVVGANRGGNTQSPQAGTPQTGATRP